MLNRLASMRRVSVGLRPTRTALTNVSAYSSASSTSRILVVGGNGAMGQAVLETFKNNGWGTCSLDLTGADERIADKSYILPSNDSISDYPKKRIKRCAEYEQKRGTVRHCCLCSGRLVWWRHW